MTKFIPCLLLLALVACGENKFEKEVARERGAVALARETTTGGYRLLTTEELKERVDKRRASKDDFLLIDAMPRASFAKEHIEGAQSFEFPMELMEEWEDSKTGGTREDFQKLLGADKSKDVILYCGYVACLRSHNAALWAVKAGFAHVYRHPGGIWAWKGSGYPTESGR